MKFTKTAKRISAFVLGLLMVIMSLDLTAIRVHAEGEPVAQRTEGTVQFSKFGESDGTGFYTFDDDFGENPDSIVVNSEIPIASGKIRFKNSEGMFADNSVWVVTDGDEGRVAQINPDEGGIYNCNFSDYYTDGDLLDHFFEIRFSFVGGNQSNPPANLSGKLNFCNHINDVPEGQEPGSGIVTVVTKASEQDEGTSRDIRDAGSENEIDITELYSISFKFTPDEGTLLDTVRGVTFFDPGTDPENSRQPVTLDQDENGFFTYVFDSEEDYSACSCQLKYGWIKDNGGAQGGDNAGAGNLNFNNHLADCLHGESGTVNVVQYYQSNKDKPTAPEAFINAGSEDIIDIRYLYSISLDFKPEDGYQLDTHRKVWIHLDQSGVISDYEIEPDEDGYYTYIFGSYMEDQTETAYNIEYGWEEGNGGNGGEGASGVISFENFSDFDIDENDNNAKIYRYSGFVNYKFTDGEGEDVLDYDSFDSSDPDNDNFELTIPKDATRIYVQFEPDENSSLARDEHRGDVPFVEMRVNGSQEPAIMEYDDEENAYYFDLDSDDYVISESFYRIEYKFAGLRATIRVNSDNTGVTTRISPMVREDWMEFETDYDEDDNPYEYIDWSLEDTWKYSWFAINYDEANDEFEDGRKADFFHDNEDGEVSNEKEINYTLDENGKVNLYVYMNWNWRPTNVINVNGQEYVMEGSPEEAENPDSPTFMNFNDRDQWLDACSFTYRDQSLRFVLSDFPLVYDAQGNLEIDVVIDILPITEEQCFVGNFGWTANPEEWESDSYIGNSHIELVRVEYADSECEDTNGNGEIDDDERIVFEAQDLYDEANKHKKDKNAQFVNFGSHQYETDEMGRINWENPQLVDYEQGEMLVPDGTKVTVIVVPNTGYQVNGFRVNDGDFIADDETVGQYTFTVGKGNFHIGADVSDASNVVIAKEAEGVSGGNVTVLDEDGNALDDFQHGVAKLEIKDYEVTEEEEDAFEAEISDEFKQPEAGKAKNIDYYDISLFNSVKKAGKKNDNGDDDFWDKPVKDLEENEADITLKLDNNVSKAEIIHQVTDRDGNVTGYEVIPAVVNTADNTISFKSSSFSDFAIVTLTLTDIQGFTLNKTSETVYISSNPDSIEAEETHGESELYCNFSPIEANPEVEWTSSNPSVAEVYKDGSGKVARIEGKKTGSAVITAKVTNSNGKVSTKTCNVTVKNGVVDVIKFIQEPIFDNPEYPDEITGWEDGIHLIKSFANITDAGDWIKNRWESEEIKFHEEHPHEEYYYDGFAIKLYADQTVAKAKIPSIQFEDRGYVEIWLNNRKLTVQGDYTMGDYDCSAKIYGGTFVANTLYVKGWRNIAYSENPEDPVTTLNVKDLYLLSRSELIAEKITVSGKTTIEDGSVITVNKEGTFNTVNLIEGEEEIYDLDGNLCPFGMNIYRFEGAKLAINGAITGTEDTRLRVGIISEPATIESDYWTHHADPDDQESEIIEGIMSEIDSKVKLFDTKLTTIPQFVEVQHPEGSESRYYLVYAENGAAWAGEENYCLRVDDETVGRYSAWKDAATAVAAVNEPDSEVELIFFKDTYVLNNFKTPKAAEIVYFISDINEWDDNENNFVRRPVKLYYTGNINLTTDTVFDNIDFMMVAADKNASEGYSVRDPYTLMTLGINGNDLIIRNRVTFNTPVNFNDSKKSGSLSLDWNAKLFTAFTDSDQVVYSGTSQKIYYANDFINDSERNIYDFSAVISGSLTNLGTFYLQDEQNAAIIDYISGVTKDKNGNVTAYTFTAPTVNVVNMTVRYGAHLDVRPLEAYRVLDEEPGLNAVDVEAMRKNKSAEKISQTVKLTAVNANIYPTFLISDNIQFTNLFLMDSSAWVQSNNVFNITNLTCYSHSNVLATMQNTSLKGNAYRTPYLNISGNVDTFDFVVQVAVIDPETGEFAELTADEPCGATTLLTAKTGAAGQFEPFHRVESCIDYESENGFGNWINDVNGKIIGIDRENGNQPVDDPDLWRIANEGYWTVYAMDKSIVNTRPYIHPEIQSLIVLKSNIPEICYTTNYEINGEDKEVVIANALECQFDEDNLNGYILKKNGQAVQLYSGDKVELALVAINSEDKNITIDDLFSDNPPEGVTDETFELLGYYPKWDEAVNDINAGKDKRRYAFVLVRNIGGDSLDNKPVTLKLPAAAKTQELTITSLPGIEPVNIYYANAFTLSSDTVFENVVLSPVKLVKKGTKDGTRVADKDGYLTTFYNITAGNYNLVFDNVSLGSTPGNNCFSDSGTVYYSGLGKISGNKTLKLGLTGSFPGVDGISGFENVELSNEFLIINTNLSACKNVHIYNMVSVYGDINITGCLYVERASATLESVRGKNFTLNNVDLQNNRATLGYNSKNKTILKINGELLGADPGPLSQKLLHIFDKSYAENAYYNSVGFVDIEPLKPDTANNNKNNGKVTLGAQNVIMYAPKVPTDRVTFDTYDRVLAQMGGFYEQKCELVKANGNFYYVEDNEIFRNSIVIVETVERTYNDGIPSEYKTRLCQSEYLDWNEAVKEINTLNNPDASYEIYILQHNMSETELKDTVLTDANKYGALTLPQAKKAKGIVVKGAYDTIFGIDFIGDVKGAGNVTFERVALNHKYNASSDTNPKNDNDYGTFKITVDKTDKNDPTTGALRFNNAKTYLNMDDAIASGTVSTVNAGMLSLRRAVFDSTGANTVDNLLLEYSDYHCGGIVKATNEINLTNESIAVFGNTVSAKTLNIVNSSIDCEKTATFTDVNTDSDFTLEGRDIIFRGVTNINTVTSTGNDQNSNKYALITAVTDKNKPLLTIKEELEKPVYIKLINPDTGLAYDDEENFATANNGNYRFEVYCEKPLVIAPKADAEKIMAYALRNDFTADGDDKVVSYRNASKYIINTKISEMLFRVEKWTANEEEIFNYEKTWNDAVNSINAANDKDAVYMIYILHPGLWRTDATASQGAFNVDYDVDDENSRVESKAPAALTFPKASAASLVGIVKDSSIDDDHTGLIYSGNLSPATNFGIGEITLTASKNVKEKNAAGKTISYFVPSGENTTINIAKDKTFIIQASDSYAEKSDSYNYDYPEHLFIVSSINGTAGSLVIIEDSVFVINTVNVKDLEEEYSQLKVQKALTVGNEVVLEDSSLVGFDNINMPKATLRMEESVLKYSKNCTIGTVDMLESSIELGDINYTGGGDLKITNLIVENNFAEIDYSFTKPTAKTPATSRLSIDNVNLDDAELDLCPSLYNSIKDKYVWMPGDEATEVIFDTDNGTLTNNKYIFDGGELGFGLVDQKMVNIKKTDSDSIFIRYYAGQDGIEFYPYMFNQGLHFSSNEPDIWVYGYKATGDGSEHSDELTYMARFSDWKQAVSDIEKVASNKIDTDNSYFEIVLYGDLGSVDAPIAFNLPGKMKQLDFYGDGYEIYMSNNKITAKSDLMLMDTSFYYMTKASSGYIKNAVDFDGGKFKLTLSDACAINENGDSSYVKDIKAQNLEIIDGPAYASGKISVADTLVVNEEINAKGDISAKNIKLIGPNIGDEIFTSISTEGSVSATNLEVDSWNDSLLSIESTYGKVSFNDITGVDGNDNVLIDYSFTSPTAKAAGKTKLDINGNINGAYVILNPRIQDYDENGLKWESDNKTPVLKDLEFTALNGVFDIYRENDGSFVFVNDYADGIETFYDKKLANAPKASADRIELLPYYALYGHFPPTLKHNNGVYLTSGAGNVIVTGYALNEDKTHGDEDYYCSEFLDYGQAIAEIDRIGSKKVGEPNSYVEVMLINNKIGKFDVVENNPGTYVLDSKPVSFVTPKNVGFFELTSYADGEHTAFEDDCFKGLNGNVRFFTNTATVNLGSDTRINNVTILKGVTGNKKKVFDAISFSGANYSLELNDVYSSLGFWDGRENDPYAQYAKVYSNTNAVPDQIMLIKNVTVKDLTIDGIGQQYNIGNNNFGNPGEEYLHTNYISDVKVSDKLTLKSGLCGTGSLSAKEIEIVDDNVWLEYQTITADVVKSGTGKITANKTANIKDLTVSEAGLLELGANATANIKNTLYMDGGAVLTNRGNKGTLTINNVIVSRPSDIGYYDGSTVTVTGTVETSRDYLAPMGRAPITVHIFTGLDGMEYKQVYEGISLIKAPKAGSVCFVVADEMKSEVEDELIYGTAYKSGDYILYGSGEDIINLYEIPATITVDAKGNMVDVNADGYLDENDYDSVGERIHISSFKKFEEAVKNIDSTARYKKDADNKDTKVFADYAIDFDYSSADIKSANGKIAALPLPSKVGILNLENGNLYFGGNVTLKSNVKCYDLNLTKVSDYIDEDGYEWYTFEDLNLNIGNYTLTLSSCYYIDIYNLSGNKSNKNSRVVLEDYTELNSDSITVNTLQIDNTSVLLIDKGFDVVDLIAVENEPARGSVIVGSHESKNNVSGKVEVLGDDNSLDLTIRDQWEIDPGTVILTVSNPDAVDLDRICAFEDFEDEDGIDYHENYGLTVLRNNIMVMGKTESYAHNNNVGGIQVDQSFIEDVDGLYRFDGNCGCYESLSHLSEYGNSGTAIHVWDMVPYSDLFVKEVWGEEIDQVCYLTLYNGDNSGMTVVNPWDSVYSNKSKIVLIPLEHRSYTLPIWKSGDGEYTLKIGSDFKTIRGDLSPENIGFYVKDDGGKCYYGTEFRDLPRDCWCDIIWEQDLDGRPGSTVIEDEDGTWNRYTEKYYFYNFWCSEEEFIRLDGEQYGDIYEFHLEDWMYGRYAVEDEQGNLLSIIFIHS